MNDNMNNKDEQGDGGYGSHHGCRGGNCWGWSHGGNRHGLHIVVKIIILVLVFWAGVKIGELKTYFHLVYGFNGGPSMMQNWKMMPGGGNTPFNMMWGNATTTPQTLP